jgi:uncharacterized membrane protein YphA (DoxX/SURF4 family)
VTALDVGVLAARILLVGVFLLAGISKLVDRPMEGLDHVQGFARSDLVVPFG